MNEKFECIIGDFYKNENGHTYEKDVWDNIIKSCLSKVYSIYVGPTLPNLNALAGEVLSINYIDEETNNPKVKLTCKLFDTNFGNIIKKLINSGTKLFITKVGNGDIDEDGVIFSYVLDSFYISSDSAFTCATPIIKI